GLSDLERQGLELAAAAIEGRTQASAAPLYAEDRLLMLNQALAALQPALATGAASASLPARDLYRALVDDVASFKHDLVSLADAQQELLPVEIGKGKRRPKPVDAGEVGDERPSTLSGPGPAVADNDRPAPPSTLSGPGPEVEKPAPPSTLSGPGPAPADRDK